MKTILVVANETLGGAPLLERVKEHAARGGDPRRDLRAADAPAARQRHLRRRRARRRAGAHRPRPLGPARGGHRRDRRARRPGPVHRRRWTPSPSTSPTRSSSRRCRRRRRAGCAATSSSASPRRPACPSSTSSPTSTPRACRSTSRSSSPHSTAAAAPLRDALKASAPRRPASTCSSSSSRRRAARASTSARRAGGWARCSSACARDGLLVAGMIGDPDPYTATMNALQFFQRRRRRHLDAARRRARAGCAPTSSSACARRRASPSSTSWPSSRSRRLRPDGRPHASRARSPTTTITTARRRPTAARASSRSCSGCCFSSSRRSWSSGPSSRPTSSSGSCRATSGSGRGHELPVAIAGVNTAILLSSSLTMHWAQTSIKNGNRLGLKAGMLATFLLGATFLFIQINEYVHIGFAPHDHAQGSVFYGLTGLHGAHVVIGLTLLAMVDGPRLPRALLARAAPRRRGARDLLALRRRHVGRRLHDDLHPLARASRMQPAALRGRGVPRAAVGRRRGGGGGRAVALLIRAVT